MPPRGSETSPSDAALDDASDSRFRRFFSFFLRFFSFLSCFLAAFFNFFFSFDLSRFSIFLKEEEAEEEPALPPCWLWRLRSEPPRAATD